MATIEELITDAENRRKSAERKVSDTKARAKEYIDALDAARIENLTPEQERMSEDLLAKHRAAVDEVKRTEGELTALCQAQAEDAEADRISWDRSTWRSTGALPRPCLRGGRMSASATCPPMALLWPPMARAECAPRPARSSAR
jgi:hypothetical protein